MFAALFWIYVDNANYIEGLEGQMLIISFNAMIGLAVVRWHAKPCLKYSFKYLYAIFLEMTKTSYQILTLFLFYYD